jgi:hypothetical protein
MVSPLPPPRRPLVGGRLTSWSDDEGIRYRVYHQDDRNPHGLYRRIYGPLERFDHHNRPSHAPAVDPGGRSVLYLGGSIGTCGAEVFGDAREARVCGRFRVIAAKPLGTVYLQELTGAAVMAIGAFMTLGSGDVARVESQAWARAIYEDHPAGRPAEGVRYLGAHDGGAAMAVWDRGGELEAVRNAAGDIADLPLRHRSVWPRFLVEMRRRRIVVQSVSADDCHKCRDYAARRV